MYSDLNGIGDFLVATGITTLEHSFTCCGQICRRRATSYTHAPEAGISAIIGAFSSADEGRRSPGTLKQKNMVGASLANVPGYFPSGIVESIFVHLNPMSSLRMFSSKIVAL